MDWNNPEELRAYYRDYGKKYREKNCDKINARQRQSYADNPERGKEYQRQYALRHPDKMREKWTSKKDDPVFKQKRKELRRAYYLKHKEMEIERAKAYSAKKRGAKRVSLTPEQWRRIKEAFDHRCAYCGKQLKNLTQDHVTPPSEGGNHEVWNIVPACRPCNVRKYNGPPPIPVQPLLL
jgi:5-methylcytosine-specific restriction endonuclease McrA